MSDFKFNNLDDKQFEQFCKDILEYETKTKFRTYRRGKDGGIDIQCLVNDSNWIGQSKNYLYSDYSTLKQTLKEEKKKLDKLKPSRYSLFLSMDISPQNEQEILSIMSPYLKGEDLYTISDLETICYKNDFSEILYNKYSNLFMPPLFLFEKHLLHDINELMNIESDNVEKHIKLDAFLKEYIAKRILDRNVEMNSFNKIEKFISSIFDWILCEKKFPCDLITTFILETKNNNKLFIKRWEIIEYYFEGQLEKGIEEIDKLLQDFSKENNSWQYSDLLIDKRCFENSLNNKDNSFFRNSAQKELLELNEVYYPVIDRKYKTIYELINNRIINQDRKSNNSFDIMDSTFQQVCEKFSDMICDIIYNGSLVHLLVLRKNFANILFMLSKYYDNDKILDKIYIQNLLVSGQIADFKKICNRNSNTLKNYTSETWNKIQNSASIFDKEKIEILFSQYLFKYSNKELKKELIKKILQYYKNSIIIRNYYNQEMILNFVCDNIKEIPIKKFIPFISKTLCTYQNNTLNKIIDKIFKKAKLQEYNSDLNNIFKYIIDNQLQDVYLYLNLRKIFYQHCNYDKIVLSILEEDLQFIYKDLINVEVNYYDFLNVGLDEFENNTILENYRIKNLLYGINKLKTVDLKVKIINRYLSITKSFLIKDNININTKLDMLKKILELKASFNYNNIDYNSIFSYIIKNKNLIVVHSQDFFESEEYEQVLELYIFIITNIILNKFDDATTVKMIDIYNKNKLFKTEIIYLIILLTKLKINFDLKSLIINIFKDINDSELQDGIIYICMISYSKYPILYEELLSKDIDITYKTYELMSKNSRKKVCRILYKKTKNMLKK